MYTYAAKLVRVLDGDTVEANIDLGFDIHYVAKIRLSGINAPEMKTPQGQPAKEHLANLLTNQDFVVTTKINKEFEKYGRVLGEITINGVSINQQMITEGFAVVMKG
jgi:micrococcal nuclease